MALVKYGGGILDMTGSIGGQVHSRNRYGKYIRARVVPVNPNTEFQGQARARVALLTEQWSSEINAAQRTSWNLYASNVAMKNKLGETIHLSGFNHFIRCNCVRLQSGLDTVGDGPVVFELPETDPLLRITASEGTQLFTVAFDYTLDWNNEDGARMVLWAGRPQNAQRNFFGGPWRFSGSFNGSAGAPIDAPQPSTTVFGVAEGQHLWLYARIQRADGRLSTPFRDDNFCAA